MKSFQIIDAFTSEKAKGNPAVLVWMDDLSDDQELQRIAAEFNQPATTFLKYIDSGHYEVRWFAPMAEIGLCGHGTLAATWWILQQNTQLETVRFDYRLGQLSGLRRENGCVAIQGEAIRSEQANIPEEVQAGFRGRVESYWKNENKDIVVLPSDEILTEMKPDWDALRKRDQFAYVLTAPSESYDFVSRVILPHISILEDQATGSAHLVLTPYWEERSGQSSFRVFQKSARGGELTAKISADTVEMEAHCSLFASGDFHF